MQRGLLSRRYVAVYVAVVFVENEAWVLDSDSDYRAPNCPIQKPSGSEWVRLSQARVNQAPILNQTFPWQLRWFESGLIRIWSQIARFAALA